MNEWMVQSDEDGNNSIQNVGNYLDNAVVKKMSEIIIISTNTKYSVISLHKKQLELWPSLDTYFSLFVWFLYIIVSIPTEIIWISDSFKLQGVNKFENFVPRTAEYLTFLT